MKQGFGLWMGWGLALLAATTLSARAKTVTFRSLLEEMTDRSVITHWPEHEYRSLQASSYNRKSKTPDDPRGWFANGDCGYAIRMETNGLGVESVLMEHQGPGVITRIWTPFFHHSMTNRTGTDLRIYLDGETTPRIATNFFQLVMGKAMIKPPFAQYTVRAGDLYLPIPFKESCKITHEGPPFFYIINYRGYALGTEVESFAPDMLVKEAGLLARTGRELTEPSRFRGGESFTIDRQIHAGKSTALDLPAGQSAVRDLEFKLEAANLPVALRSTVLEMCFDGETTVWCPIGDFFSNVNGVDPPHRMWERDTLPDGTMICRWIMPYRKTATLRIHNFAKAPVSVRLNAFVSPWSWRGDSLYFHTSWWMADRPTPSRPVWDMNFIEVKGRGIHVGDTLVVLNPLYSWWGEGDEKVYVDDDIDRRFPSHWGTGSEDYYGWAGGEVPRRRDEFSAPFVANVRVGGSTNAWPAGQEPYTHGYNICTRTRSLDATPFARRFRFDMEAFNMIGTPDAYLHYTLVTHWYAAPGATDNRPPMPEAAARPVMQVEDAVAFVQAMLAKEKPVLHIQDAIELENFTDVTLSPGLTGEARKMGDAKRWWSNGAQYEVKALKVGDSATFTFTEQYKAREVIVYPTLAPDYGRLNFFINGRPARLDWDGYAREARPGYAMNLGAQPPDGNLIRLKVEVSGRNPASRGFAFGLDCVVLEPVAAK